MVLIEADLLKIYKVYVMILFFKGISAGSGSEAPAAHPGGKRHIIPASILQYPVAASGL